MAEPVYRDLDFGFKKHPLTGDLSTLTDEAAIKTSMRNLVKLSKYDKPFNPEIRSPVYDLLFEPIDFPSSILLENDLYLLILAYEPRVENLKVSAKASPDENKYDVTINYTIKKLRNAQTLELTLPIERLR